MRSTTKVTDCHSLADTHACMKLHACESASEWQSVTFLVDCSPDAKLCVCLERHLRSFTTQNLTHSCVWAPDFPRWTRASWRSRQTQSFASGLVS